MKLIVAQLGSRMHYAVPRILHASGMLSRLWTDICAVKSWPRLLGCVPFRLQPAVVKRLLGRVPEGVPADKIRALTGFGWTYARRRAAARTSSERTEVYLWAGKQFCELVLYHGLPGVSGVYTFNSAGLELLRHARQRGLRAVVEQTIAPQAVELRLLAEEHARFPGWEAAPGADGPVKDFCERERAEWHEADVIVCGSEFVRDAVAACGGPVERCAVVPYGVDERFAVPERPPHDGPLRVLIVGAVGLRKGSPYVLEAARRLAGRAVFRMAGPIGVAEAAARQLRQHVELLGAVPRSEIVPLYAWADVFLLPSLCEGSATVTYEALRCGLPVICTPNTGSVVRDGTDGFIVPVRDVDAVVGRLELLHKQPERLHEMARQARARAAEFDLARYGERLTALLRR